MKINKNIFIMITILALLILPFFVARNGEFGGADQNARAIVMEIDPNYQPIAENIFEPASGEIESMLFTLQGAIGACFIGYYIGKKLKKHKADEI